MRYIRANVIVFIFVLAMACTDDEIGPVGISGSVPVLAQESYLYVANEGNFGFSNASVSIVSIEKGDNYQRVFLQANGLPLGDVAQSIAHINHQFCIAVNNSGLVRVVNDSTWLQEAEIESPYPRYTLQAGGKLWTTNLYTPAVTIASKQNTTWETRELTTRGSTEHLLFDGVNLWINAWNPNEILVVNPFTEVIQTRIALADSAFGIARTTAGEVITATQNGILSCGTNGSVDTIYAWKGMRPFRFQYHPKSNRFYWLDNGLWQWRKGQDPNRIEGLTFIENAYGLGCDTLTGNIAIADAKDYQNRGEIIVLDSNHTILKRFPAGVIPQHLMFLNQ